MSFIYTLTTPITVGDFSNSITIKSLKLTSISLNFEDAYSKQGTAILSICLVDPDTGYPVNVVYQDPSALTTAQTIEGQIGEELFQKMIADSKLPPGTLTTT